MNFFSYNDRYCHLQIYELFLLYHPVYRLAQAEQPAAVQSVIQCAIFMPATLYQLTSVHMSAVYGWGEGDGELDDVGESSPAPESSSSSATGSSSMKCCVENIKQQFKFCVKEFFARSIINERTAVRS